jgi:tripartite-type tricarboxylate transporter receptor subunit TctC
VADRIATVGAEPAPSTSEAFGAYIRSESEKWGKVVAEAGVKE